MAGSDNHSRSRDTVREPPSESCGDLAEPVTTKRIGLGPSILCLVLGSENHLFSPLHKVRGAAYSQWAAVEHMGVDHGGAHILMAQQLLDGADVLAPLQQVGGK